MLKGTIDLSDLQDALQHAMEDNGSTEERNEMKQDDEKRPCEDDENKNPTKYTLQVVDEERNANVEGKETILLKVVDDEVESKVRTNFEESEEVRAKYSLKLDEKQNLKGSVDQDIKGPSLEMPAISITTFLENVLSKVAVPVSVSFINSFFIRNKQATISESFFKCKENQDKFSFFLLGCDFKITVKEISETKATSGFSMYESEFLDNVEKDLLKLKELKGKFDEKKIVDISYTDFQNEYSSNKYKMKLPFIVRNSHALKIYRKDERTTHVRYITGDEQVIKAWDFNKGIESLLVHCTKELLEQFNEPIDASLIQTCYNFGGECTISKSFFSKYPDIFERDCNRGFTLRGRNGSLGGCAETNILRNVNPVLPQSPTSQKMDCKVSSTCEKLTENQREVIDEAMLDKRSIIVLGNNGITPIPIIYYDGIGSYSDRLAGLEKLSKFIDNEIEKLES